VADQLKKQQLQRLVADLEAKTLEVTEIKETLYLIKEEK